MPCAATDAAGDRVDTLLKRNAGGDEGRMDLAGGTGQARRNYRKLYL